MDKERILELVDLYELAVFLECSTADLEEEAREYGVTLAEEVPVTTDTD
jgi:hypothetical protein